MLYLHQIHVQYTETKRPVNQLPVLFCIIFYVPETPRSRVDVSEFVQITGDPGRLVDSLEQLIRADGIELRYEAMPHGTDGYSTNDATCATA